MIKSNNGCHSLYIESLSYLKKKKRYLKREKKKFVKNDFFFSKPIIELFCFFFKTYSCLQNIKMIQDKITISFTYV